jgi:hypothetical protein
MECGRLGCLEPWDAQPDMVALDFQVEFDAREPHNVLGATDKALSHRKAEPARIDILCLLSNVVEEPM